MRDERKSRAYSHVLATITRYQHLHQRTAMFEISLTWIRVLGALSWHCRNERCIPRDICGVNAEKPRNRYPTHPSLEKCSGFHSRMPVRTPCCPPCLIGLILRTRRNAISYQRRITGAGTAEHAPARLLTFCQRVQRLIGYRCKVYHHVQTLIGGSSDN